jgi:O-acetyl-ADP-ribose deacetylase (regulator of RNase III)
MLLGGSGVDGAIHQGGGPEILQECKMLRERRFPEGLPAGEAVATSAGKLPAKWVIHTVGPVFGQWNGRDAEILRSCYWNSLVLARELGATSVSFPSISTGVYGYPKDLAAQVVSETLTAIQGSIPGIKQVNLVFFNEDDLLVFLDNETFPN